MSDWSHDYKRTRHTIAIDSERNERITTSTEIIEIQDRTQWLGELGPHFLYHRDWHEHNFADDLHMHCVYRKVASRTS